eukprot:CAMPEP_0180688974 /NCGR_PEP_ID=MMETSP1037_2-20121125/74257_1 /TAXON_ID=632150 /ORGANISM="Azadinium spinosum, Strain 3D9" /LENGTH=61 /DNA_ID=CAMNT_0022719831 /DNA_START=491 /DNA_END=676 /DNA_ORIENTATION=+
MEHVQQGEVVAIQVSEATPGLIGSLRRSAGPEEDRLHAEHRGDRERLIAALVPRRVDEHLC